VVLDTRSLHGVGAGRNGVEVGCGAPYPADWHRAYGVLELCMHKKRR